MTYVSIDRMTRSVLGRMGLPIHYYVEMAWYIVYHLRELRLHTLGVVNTKNLPVTSYGAIEIPCDFIDWVSVKLPYGQLTRELIQRESINRLNNYDTATGEKIPFETPTEGGQGGGVSELDINHNEHGEDIGRWFGIRQGEQSDTFKVLRERGEIQLHNAISAKEVQLEYISSGEGDEEDTATKVDFRAQAALETYAERQYLHRRQRHYADADYRHKNALRILRAQISDLGELDVQRIIRDAYSLTIKH